MKNILILLIIAFVLTNYKVQQIVNLNTFNRGDNTDKYFKDIDNHYERFLGIWGNTTGTKTF